MSRSLRTLTDDEIRVLVSDNFGLDVQMDQFLSGEIAINARVTAQDSAYVFKAEYPSRTMTPEYADWLSTAHQAAYESGVPVAANPGYKPVPGHFRKILRVRFSRPHR